MGCEIWDPIMGDFKFQAFWLFGFFYMQWRASEELCFKKETGSGMNVNEDEEGSLRKPERHS